MFWISTNALKKLISIVLVFLLLFNALGIYGLLEGLRYKTTQDLVHRLDRDQYSGAETILLKVPIAVPYAQDGVTYERVDGEFEYQGETYRLVKQKYQNGMLFLICIKDHASGKIKKALADYVKTFTDKPVDAKNSVKISFSFIKDFLPSKISLKSVSHGWDYDLNFENKEYELLYRTQSITSPPPRG